MDWKQAAGYAGLGLAAAALWVATNKFGMDPALTTPVIGGLLLVVGGAMKSYLTSKTGAP